MAWHSYEDPQHAANKYLKQIPGQLHEQYDPYTQMGQRTMGNLEGQYGQMMGQYDPLQQQYSQLMNDPAAMLAHLGSGFTESPQYQWEYGQAEQGINNAMQAGGMTGSPEHQQRESDMASHMANKYYQDYMKNVMGLYGKGLQGESNLFGQGLHGEQQLGQMGFSATKDLASGLAQALMQQANLGYSGAANRNQHYGNLHAMYGKGLSNTLHGKSFFGQGPLSMGKTKGETGQQNEKGTDAAQKIGMMATLMAML